MTYAIWIVNMLIKKLISKSTIILIGAYIVAVVGLYFAIGCINSGRKESGNKTPNNSINLLYIRKNDLFCSNQKAVNEISEYIKPKITVAKKKDIIAKGIDSNWKVSSGPIIAYPSKIVINTKVTSLIITSPKNLNIPNNI